MAYEIYCTLRAAMGGFVSTKLGQALTTGYLSNSVDHKDCNLRFLSIGWAMEDLVCVWKEEKGRVFEWAAYKEKSTLHIWIIKCVEEGKTDDRIIKCRCLQGNRYETIGMIVYFHLLHVTYYCINTIGHYFSLTLNGKIQCYFCLPLQNNTRRDVYSYFMVPVYFNFHHN